MLFIKFEILWGNLRHDLSRLSFVERFLLLSWLLILGLMPFHAFISTWGGATIGPLEVWKSWKEILLLVCLLVSAVYLQYKGHLRQLLRDNLVAVILLYAFLHVVLWVILQPEVRPALAGLLMNLRYLGMVLLTLVLLTFVAPKQLMRQGFSVVFVGGAIVLLFGLLQATVLPDDFLRHFGYGSQTIAPVTTLDDNQEIPRVQSTLRGPNPFGAFLVIVVPLLLVVWKRGRETFLAGWLLIAGLLLFHSHSRSAWLGMVAALAVYAFLRIRTEQQRRLVAAALGVVVGGSALFLSWAVPQSAFLQTTILHNKTTDVDAGSTAEHWLAAERSVGRVADEPLGQGPGAAGPASFYGDKPQIPENYYLQIAEEVGVLGIVVFGAINAIIWHRLWRRRRNTWAAAMLASFVGIGVVNLFQQGWADETVAIIWWTLATLVIAYTHVGSAVANGTHRRTSG